MSLSVSDGACKKPKCRINKESVTVAAIIEHIKHQKFVRINGRRQDTENCKEIYEIVRGLTNNMTK